MSTNPLDKVIKKITGQKLEAAKAPPPKALPTQAEPFYDDEPWPELPSENEKPPKAPFPLMALPEPMQAYCKAVSESTGTPIDYAAIPILGAMAGAIGASTKLMINQLDHHR